MSQLRRNQERLDQLEIKVKVVTFDNEDLGQLYASDTNLPWPLLFDTSRQLYGAYGFEQGSWWSILNPTSIVRYVKLIFKGESVGIPGEDWRQLGGDVLIDPEGNVRLHHANRGAHDRPSIDQICEIVEKANKES